MTVSLFSFILYSVMATITQNDTARTVRVSGEVFRAVKSEAIRSRRTITETIDYAMRKGLKMPQREVEDAA